jgi:hypothetical protein
MTYYEIFHHPSGNVLADFASEEDARNHFRDELADDPDGLVLYRVHSGQATHLAAGSRIGDEPLGQLAGVSGSSLRAAIGSTTREAPAGTASATLTTRNLRSVGPPPSLNPDGGTWISGFGDERPHLTSARVDLHAA